MRTDVKVSLTTVRRLKFSGTVIAGKVPSAGRVLTDEPVNPADFTQLGAADLLQTSLRKHEF